MSDSELEQLVKNALVCAHKVKTSLNSKDKANKNEWLDGIVNASLINESTIMWLEDIEKHIKGENNVTGE